MPVLLVVADLAYVGDEQRWLDVLAEVGEAARGRPVAVQVRAKEVAPEAFEGLAAKAREAVPREVLLVLNGPESLAVRLGYEGVHWPEAAIPEADGGALSPTLSRSAGEGAGALAWRSAAVHSEDAVRKAERAGAMAVVFGSVFEPGSKVGDAAGLQALRAVCAAAQLPVYAIGGITPARVAACMQAGVVGVGVVSGVIGAESPARAIESYLAAMGAVAWR